MEHQRLPEQEHSNCPNCGFELDLSPPEREQTARDLGSVAVGINTQMTEHQTGILIRPEEVDTHCLVIGLADIALNKRA